MTWRSLSGFGVVLALMLGLGLPSAAAAGDGGGSRLVGFWAKASNGYRFAALTTIPSPGGKGWVVVFLTNKHGQVTYGVPARVTRRGLDANLGRMGRISVDRVMTGRKKTVRRGCNGRGRKRVEAQRYEGTIEFHGEEGYTDVSATRAPLEYVTFCSGDEDRGPASDLSGARLDVEKRGPGKLRIEFDAIKRRSGARTALKAEITEPRGRIIVQREAWGRAGASALSYDGELGTATVKPPAPYSGEATFRSDPASGGRWTGDLSVDFPGRSGVRLTGRGFTATLERLGG